MIESVVLRLKWRGDVGEGVKESVALNVQREKACRGNALEAKGKVGTATRSSASYSLVIRQ